MLGNHEQLKKKNIIFMLLSSALFYSLFFPLYTGFNQSDIQLCEMSVNTPAQVEVYTNLESTNATIDKVEKDYTLNAADQTLEKYQYLGIEFRQMKTITDILNKPEVNERGDLVISGHALMQPRVGVGLVESRKSIFTQVYAGEGGTDSYTNNSFFSSFVMSRYVFTLYISP